MEREKETERRNIYMKLLFYLFYGVLKNDSNAFTKKKHSNRNCLYAINFPNYIFIFTDFFFFAKISTKKCTFRFQNIQNPLIIQTFFPIINQFRRRSRCSPSEWTKEDQVQECLHIQPFKNEYQC